MRSYNEIKEKYKFPEKVEQIIKYYAYKNGNSVLYDTRQEAESYSKMIERVCINQDKVDEYWIEYKNVNTLVFDTWYDELREEYSRFNDDQFNLIYRMACDKGDSYGYDEVASYMIQFSAFADSLLDTVK